MWKKPIKTTLNLLEEILTDKKDVVEVQPTSATQSTKEMGDTGKGYTGQSNESGPPDWALEGNRLAGINLEDTIVNINRSDTIAIISF